MWMGTLAAFALLPVSQGFAPPIRAAQEPQPVTFADLFTASSRGVVATPCFFELQGQRVRIEGYIADILPDRPDTLFLTPRPTHTDESGAGFGDLPPNTILLVLQPHSLVGLPDPDQRVEVVGTLRPVETSTEKPAFAAAEILIDPVDAIP